jgi:hypothetical protein
VEEHTGGEAMFNLPIDSKLVRLAMSPAIRRCAIVRSNIGLFDPRAAPTPGGRRKIIHFGVIDRGVAAHQNYRDLPSRAAPRYLLRD